MRKKTLFILMIIITGMIFNTISFSDDFNKQSIALLGEDNEAILKMFGDLGYKVQLLLNDNDLYSSIEATDILIVNGSDTALNAVAMKVIQDRVAEGMNLLIVGQSELAERFGIVFEDHTHADDHAVDILDDTLDIFWSSELRYSPVMASDDYTVFTTYKKDQSPAIFGLTSGAGRIIYAETLVDNTAEHSYIRFPYLINHIIDYFNLVSSIRVDDVRVYMDWGYHYEQSPQALVKTLKDAGVSEVHLSAWYELERVDSFYTTFIDLCHADGILVYAWFELPMVSKLFWDEHPEYREKNLLGEDAIVGWRYLMAVEDPSCTALVKQEMKSIIQAFNWDGVNLAELYFEPAEGFHLKEDITPFGDYFTKLFIETYGINPKLIFNEKSGYYHEKNNVMFDHYVDLRKQIITELTVDYIRFLDSLSKDLDLYITMIDDSVDSKISNNIGSSTTLIMKALDTINTKLQIEDPFFLWDVGSERYLAIGKDFSHQYNQRFESIDINVVERNYAYPTHQQTGAEYNAIVSDGSKYTLNAHLYAANTVYEMDFTNTPYIIGSHIDIDYDTHGFSYDSSKTFKVTGDYADKVIYVDDRQWLGYTSDYLLMPKGRHNVIISEQGPINSDNQLRITDSNADIVAIVETDDSLMMAYQSNRTAIVQLNRRVTNISVDGEPLTPQYYYNGESFAVRLPEGHHTVTFQSELNEDILISLNGKIETFNNTLINENNHVMIPLLELLDKMGYTYTIHDVYKTVSGQNNGSVFWLQIGNPKTQFNGLDITLTVAPFEQNGIFYVPIELIKTILNHNVVWNVTHKIIGLNSMD